jgi:hypothetical protein
LPTPFFTTISWYGQGAATILALMCQGPSAWKIAVRRTRSNRTNIPLRLPRSAADNGTSHLLGSDLTTSVAAQLPGASPALIRDKRGRLSDDFAQNSVPMLRGNGLPPRVRCRSKAGMQPMRSACLFFHLKLPKNRSQTFQGSDSVLSQQRSRAQRSQLGIGSLPDAQRYACS